MKNWTANLLLLLVGAIWGMGFVAQSTAMDAIGPIFFTGIRFLTAAICVLPLAIWEIRKMPLGKSDFTAQIPNYAFLGTLLFAALATQQIGLVTTSVTNSGFLTGMYVVLVPIMTVILFKQQPHPIIWPAALTTLLGIYLLSGGDLTKLQIGDVWTIICAFFWAAHVVFLGRVLTSQTSDTSPFILACTQFFICAIWGLAIGLATEDVNITSITAASNEILFAGIVSGGIAFSLQAIAQRHTTAPQAAIFMSSEALFAALFGALLLTERIGVYGIIGCLLIFLAILVVETAPMLKQHIAKK